MKKVCLFVTILVTCSMFLSTGYAAQKTLNELKSEAQANRDAYNKAKSQKAETEAEKNEATKQKQEVESQISSIQSEVTNVQNQIEKIQKDIDKKNEQMKDIMSFVQVTDGENNYLEYIFGATDFTDFIYRVSVAEQLGNYNETLIKEYNKSAKELENKKNELASKQSELTKKQQELATLEAKLNQEVQKISEGMLTQDQEYKETISLINNLISLGCSGSETMSSCQARIAKQSKGNSGGSANYNGTYMPLTSGQVTSGYGWRTGEFHTGIDFSNGSVSNVYPVASGQVVNYKDGSTSTCGNHIIYVYHPDYGYTTSYWHLTNRSVSLGQWVNPGTVLGQIGGRGYTDPCAYGGHVHLNLFNGLTTSNSGRIDPKTWLKNIPSQGVWFTSYR